ncbi:MAG: DUF58 domain-containing protein [Thermoguttaceae bacterium]|nr:DUF58 domain-containing protein [Thermoguttaceae bacterium]MBQ6829261.1 DUF58 domain-containing protein [Thermoguttaceae bacterium]MBQ9799940.1 DUF58 domain-containing protein [Thermoguttaceae bacterium]
MRNSESYLDPKVARTIKRLDLKAQFIVKGFMHGLHASPLQGFSVEFSEHRKYERGDDPKDIDWRLFARTDKYYVRKYEAETNMTGWLVVDASASMGRAVGGGETSKFEYAISLAAALCYLMIGRQDPVGLVAFDEKIRRSLPPKSKRSHFASILSTLANLEPSGTTDVAAALTQLAGMLKRASLTMIFSDLLGDPEETLRAIYRLRHAGHDVILFHILDEAEVKFPFRGDVELEDPETGERIVVDADSIRGDYEAALSEFRERFRREASNAKFDFVELDTSVPFDKALLEYLTARAQRR